MKFVLKLMALSIMLNFAVGIMLTAIVDAEGNPVFNPGNTFGMTYEEDYASDFESGMNSTVTPQGGLQNTGDANYRVLDMMSIGFIGRFIASIDKYMFGFVQVLEGMIGGTMIPRLRIMIFGALRVLITIGYIMGAFWLWANKDLN